MTHESAPVDPSTTTFSKLVLDVQIPVEELERRLAEQLPVKVFEMGESEHGLQVKATRIGKIGLIPGPGKRIRVSFVLRLQASKDFLLAEASAEGVLQVGLLIHYDLTSTFGLTTKTEIIHFSWLEKPEVDIGLFNFSVASVMYNAIHRRRQRICKSIDEAIANLADPGKWVPVVLKRFESPVVVVNGFPIRILSLPQKLALTVPEQKEGRIRCQLQLSEGLRLSIGDVLLEKRPLEAPFFQWVEKAESTGYKLPLLIDWKLLETLAVELLRHAPMEYAGLKFEVKTLQLSGDGHTLLAKATVDGAVEGTFHLHGVPYYDGEEATIRFRQVKVSVGIRSGWKERLLRMFIGRLTHAIEKELRLPLQPLLDTYLEGDHRTEDGLHLAYKVDDFFVEEIVAKAVGLVVVVLGRGWGRVV